MLQKTRILKAEETVSSGFITLKVGKAATEKFLKGADTTTLKWIRRNTPTYIQADTIERDYLAQKQNTNMSSALSTRIESPGGVISGQSADPHTSQAIVASQTESTDGSDDHSDVRNQSQPQTPSAETPLRTPSLKLSFKPKGTPNAPSSLPAPPGEGSQRHGSNKKRKREGPSVDPEPKSHISRAPTLLKLVTKQKPSTLQNSAATPGIKLKTKGKIPKRPMGVGYDSELEGREVDPVILEGLVLRMLPGEDCDYVRDSIANGTVGISILQRGADIRLRFLDVNGRRGIMYIRGRQYAFSVVDLPTITEGMKSWDKKTFIKSIDISQLCLVLGRCHSDEEARNYPLPPDVNPKNFQYAHGLTAPMRNVRKRRFERTARARLDDIEAIERKVNALFEADSRAAEVRHEVLDHDPRHDEESSSEYGSEVEDAEGEEDDGYFQHQNDAAEGQYAATPEETYTHEDLSTLGALLEGDDDDDVFGDPAIPTTTTTAQPSSAGPTDSAAPSPAALDTGTPAAETPLSGEVDDADADDDDEGHASDVSESDQEANDEKAETLAKIKETEDKIAQQMDQMKKTTNVILRKKIAKKVESLQGDIRMMKRQAGLAEKEDADDGDVLGAGAEEQSEEE